MDQYKIGEQTVRDIKKKQNDIIFFTATGKPKKDFF